MTTKDILGRISSAKTVLNERKNALSQTDRFIRLAEYAVRFALGFLLAGGKLLGDTHPLAMGLIASTPVGIAGLVTYLGACLGHIISAKFIRALKYICMGLLIYTSRFVFRDLPLGRKPWFIALCAGFMSLCVGFVYVHDAGWTFSALSHYLIETALIAILSYLYRIALSPWHLSGENQIREMVHAVGVLVLFSTIAVCLSEIKIFGLISLGRIPVYLMVMLIAFKGGIGPGCACGLICGLVLDLASNNMPYFTMLYTFSGLVGGVFSKHGRLTCTVSLILANAAGVLWTWTNFPSPAALYETFISAVIFIVLPGSVLAKAGALFPSVTSGYGVLRAREYTRKRAEETASVFKELAETVKYVSGDTDEDEAAAVFDRASEEVCRKCALSSRCWKREKEKTVESLSSLAPKIISVGSVDPADFSKDFTENCVNFETFVSAVNEEIRALAYRRQYRARLRESFSSVYGHYVDTSAVLTELSSELGSDLSFEPGLERKLQKYLSGIDIDASAAVFRDKGGRIHAEISGAGLYRIKRDQDYLDKLSSVLGTRLCTAPAYNSSSKIVLLEAEPLAASVGIACVKKKGQEVCGDKATYFKTDEGILHIILSDGMGTGDFAAKCSDSAVKILERFLCSGVSAKTALRILNSVMLLRNENETSFATIDLVSIDLFSGNTTIYKYGSAPTYLKKGGLVKRIKSENLAAGLSSSELNSECFKVRLSSGTISAIISDGVLGGSDDKWLTDMLLSFEGNDPKDLACQILREASNKFGSEDDMTVITLYIEDRP